MEDWKQELRRLRRELAAVERETVQKQRSKKKKRFFAKRAKPEQDRVDRPEKWPAPNRPSSEPSTAADLYISLGVDFGTTYSKVGWRDLEEDSDGIVQFRFGRDASPFAPSTVQIDQEERCYTPFDVLPSGTLATVEYLKMRLAGEDIGEPLDLPTRVDSGEPAPTAVIRALSAYYLSRLITVAKSRIRESNPDLFRSRTPIWVPCLGLPVAQYDSDKYQEFREVLGVAWSLSDDDIKNPKLSTLLEMTARIDGESVAQEAGAETYPEIGAAVLSFLQSSEARPGVYAYFDVGGGTVDGVTFRYRQGPGRRTIEYFTGFVEPLGIEALAAELRQNVEQPGIEVFRDSVITGDDTVVSHISTDSAKRKVQQLVGKVIGGGKRCDASSWRIARMDESGRSLDLAEGLPDVDVQKLPVFLAGGGAHAVLHRAWIEQTYDDHQHGNAGIPPYELRSLPRPDSVRKNPNIERYYDRLAVAYGLAATMAATVKTVALPSAATAAVVQKAQIDFDNRAMETYGEIV